MGSVGDDEQFATAGALIAQAFGYQSRVVVGVRLGTGEVGGIPECNHVCSGKNLAAWIQVRAPGAGGWTTFDIEPQFANAPHIVNVQFQPPKNPTAPKQQQAQTIHSQATSHTDHALSHTSSAPNSDWFAALARIIAVLILVLLTFVLIALPFFVILVAKQIRLVRRQQAGSPDVSVVGAWEELIDVFIDHRIPIPSGTRREIALHIGTDAVSELANIADRAVFSEDVLSREILKNAWRATTTEKLRVRHERGWWASLWARLSLRSFFRRL